MTSLFADQFSPVRPYGLGPLATGVPQVGIRLPNSDSNTPASEGTGTSVTGGAAAGAEAAAGATEGLVAGQDQSNSVGQASQNAAARQGTLNKLNHMSMAGDTQGAPSSTYAPGSFDINLTKPSSGANANIPSPEWGQRQPKVTPQTYIDQTPTSPHSMPAGTVATHVNGGTSYNTPSASTTPAVFGNGRVGSPGIWDLVRGTGGQLVHDVATAGHDMLNTFQNQNSFGDKNFQVPNTPGGYSTAGTIAQHGQPASDFTSLPGTSSSYAPGVSSSDWNIGTGEGPSSFGGYGQAAANDTGSDASHINWAQFFRTAASDAGDEG